jgi:hypothetical protein
MLFRVLPVVELEPSHLGVQNFCELQEGGGWRAFWDLRLSRYGLRPVQPGSWFISTSEFTTEAAVDLLLRVHGGDGGDSPTDVDDLGPIPGGCAFACGETVQLEPGCCCDLADLSEWCRALCSGDACTRLNIGHGVFSLERSGDVVMVRMDCEREGGEPVLLHWPTDELEAALTRAESERNRFAVALEAYVRRISPRPQARDLARRLVFGFSGDAGSAVGPRDRR